MGSRIVVVVLGGRGRVTSNGTHTHPTTQAYADLELAGEEDAREGDWYRPYVDWRPPPHAAVASHEQYEAYEREYRSKYDVYHRCGRAARVHVACPGCMCYVQCEEVSERCGS